MFSLRILPPSPHTARAGILRIERTSREAPWYTAHVDHEGRYVIWPSSGEWGRRKFFRYRERLGLHR